MRCSKKLTLAVLAAVLGVVSLPSGGGAQAPARGRAPAPSPAPSPATSPATSGTQGPTAVEQLNRSLNPGDASDPDVPLPHPDLANVGPTGARSTGTRIYGRQEEGGGVLGLKMQIPVERSALPAPASPPPVPAPPGISQGR